MYVAANTASSLRLERSSFVPPRAGYGRLRGWLLALVAHGLLAVTLFWTVRTPVLPDAPAPMVQAELWEQAIEPLPQPALPPAAVPKPVPEPQPQPEAAEREAEIALEEKRRQEEAERIERERQQQLEAERLARARQEQREQERLAREAAQREAAEQARREEAERLAQEKQAQEAREREEQKQREAAAKAAAEEAARQKAREQAAEKKRQEEARLAEQRRQEQIRRMQGLAAGSGGSANTATAGSPAPTSRPSSGYAGRIKASILPNIVYPGAISGNPLAVVRVRVAPDGTILSATISRRSGTPAWDAAVLRAVQKTAVLPRDRDGSVPADMLLEFRPRD